jgi:hypothetical protein
VFASVKRRIKRVRQILGVVAFVYQLAKGRSDE